MRLILYYFLILTFVFLLGCKRKCKEYDDYPQFTEMNSIEGIQQIDTDIHTDSMSDSYIIRTDSTYQILINKTLEHTLCEYCDFAEIDFEQYDLIGKATASFNSLKKVVEYNENTYKYILKIQDDPGTTFEIQFSMNWIIIPKIELSDTVIFEVYFYGCEYEN